MQSLACCQKFIRLALPYRFNAQHSVHMAALDDPNFEVGCALAVSGHRLEGGTAVDAFGQQCLL